MIRKNENGFTVVELLITVLFIAILLAMALRVGKRATQQADFAAGINTFVSDLAYARQLASRENRYVAFDFSDDGTSYTMLVQRQIGLDLSNPASFAEEKVVEPNKGLPFVTAPTDFSVNAMGLIRDYPVDQSAPPITIVMNFFRKDRLSGEISHQKKLTIFPYGGVKID